MENLLKGNIEEVLIKLITSSNTSLPTNEVLEMSIETLAISLCGIANKSLVYSFIDGINNNDFFNNVMFNNKSSIPLIIRVIQLRLTRS